jgi:hypothetical protein
LIVFRDVAVTAPSVRRAAVAPSSDRLAIVSPARFALFARSFSRPWSPTCRVERLRDVRRLGPVCPVVGFRAEVDGFRRVVDFRRVVVLLGVVPEDPEDPLAEEEAPELPSDSVTLSSS